MDKEVLRSIIELLNGFLAKQLLATAVVSVLAAAIGAYFGAYLKKKAERRVEREEFRTVLGEQLELTLKTENVRSAIASAAANTLETLKTDLQQRLTTATFWRERAVKMKDMVFEAAIALDTLQENCQSIAWLEKTSIDEIHDRGHSALARIDYALAQLSEMHVFDPTKAVTLRSLRHSFKGFAGAVAGYQDHFARARTVSQDEADAASERITQYLMEESKKWREELQKLREVVAELAVAPEPSVA